MKEPSEQALRQLAQFFLRTTVPRIMKEKREKEKQNTG